MQHFYGFTYLQVEYTSTLTREINEMFLEVKKYYKDECSLELHLHSGPKKKIHLRRTANENEHISSCSFFCLN